MSAKGNKKLSASDIAVAVILIALGAFLIFIGVLMHRDMVRLKEACTETSTAIVVSTEEKSGKHKTHRAKLFFVTREGEAVNAYTKWSSQRYKVNETLKINYDPDDTKRVYIDGKEPYSNSGMALYTFTGAFFGGFGILILIPKRRKRRSDKCQTSGKKDRL